MESKLLTPKETADELGISPSALRQPYINIPKVPDEYPTKYRKEHVEFAKKLRLEIDKIVELSNKHREAIADLQERKADLRAKLKDPYEYTRIEKEK